MMIAGALLLRSQPAADRQTVFSRQHQVEHHQVITVARELLVHRRGVGHGLYFVALITQVFHQQVAVTLVVVDDEDAGLEFGHGQYIVTKRQPAARQAA
jgi:hypothetical protein